MLLLIIYLLECINHIKSVHFLEGQVEGCHREGNGSDGLQSAELSLDSRVGPQWQSPVRILTQPIVPRKVSKHRNFEVFVSFRNVLKDKGSIVLLFRVFADQEVICHNFWRGTIKRQID